jgi:2Fe-2S ferredoxin
MLAGTAAQRQANSRLACQLKLGPELDGLVVRVPEMQ